MAGHAVQAHDLLRVEHLSKRYGDSTVVDDLSFTIAAGECLGVIGPNGAGKTTTIRMCLGLSAPDAGLISYALQGPATLPGETAGRPQVSLTASLDGNRQRLPGGLLSMPQDAMAIKARLGVVSQLDTLDPDFSCAENLLV